MSFRNYFDKLNRYFWFQKDELTGFLITVLVLAFIFSFDKWGDKQFDAVVGMFNLFIAVIIVAMSVFVHHAAQRLAALSQGFRAEHILWWQGLTFASLIALFTNGRLKFLPGSALMIHHLPVHRLGFFRYGPKFETFATIATVGPVANLALAAFSRFFVMLGFETGFFADLYYFNLVFAVYNLLPFPPLDGSRIFYASRLLYAFVFSAILGYILLALTIGVRSYILAAFIGAIVWFLFYFYFEREWV